MNSTDNIKTSFEELIISFLSEEDRSQFNQNLVEKYIQEENIASSVSSIEKSDLENPRNFQIRRFQIENLLTKLGEKLEDGKFYDLLLNLGKATNNRGEFDIASDLFEMLVLRVKDNKKYSDFLAHAYLGKSEALTKQAIWALSIKYALKANKLFSVEKDFLGMAKCENLLGVIYGEQGEFAKAEMHFGNALEFLYIKGDKYVRGMVDTNLGIVNLALNNYDIALTRFQRALSVFEQFEDFGKIAEVRYNIGILMAHKSEYEPALAELDQSIQAALKAERVAHLGKSYLSKASMFAELKKYPLAIAYANKAMDIGYRTNDRLSVADIYKIKGVVHRRLRNKELSENYLLTSLRLNKELNNKYNFAETSFELGLLYKEWEQKEKSAIYLKDALDYNKEIGAWRDVKKIETILSELC